jgi:hypothetical protein
MALKLLIALKNEWKREPSLLKCRNMADVAFGILKSQEEYDIGVKFLCDNGFVKMADRDGKKIAQPSGKGLSYIDSLESTPESVHPHAPAEGDSRWTKGFFDDVFKFLESIGFVFWMVHEFLPDTHKVWLLIAIVFALAGAFYILAHKIFFQKQFIVLSWLAYFVCVCVIIEHSTIRRPEANLPPTSAAFMIIPREEYIELKTPRYFLMYNYGSQTNSILSPIHVRLFEVLPIV